jgi:hydroxyethylthiazole kinase
VVDALVGLIKDDLTSMPNMIDNSKVLQRAADAFPRLRARGPRVQCLTNTVAQAITANTLLALGCRVSMATHVDEVIAMTESADALLINLGTLDAGRVDAIAALSTSARARAMPVVLDPVFVEHSPLRMKLALDVLGWDRVIVKGNATEMRALGDDALSRAVARITTGAVDQISTASGAVSIANGVPVMAQVTGLGCALGAVVAAMSAVEPDPLIASIAALLTVEIAAEHAMHRSTGPGTFASYLLDALATFDPRDIASDAKLESLEPS